MTITLTDMQDRLVRYAELIPCKTAFIDAHTPGSDQKENFTIIGGGVSESADQHVHLSLKPGFNIGAAGQPPKCRNSMHTHTTAEVFFVLSGTWRFFWGRYGDAGEVTLQPGDLIDIPTHLFRGFENIGNDYGMIMAVLGGDDAGGGVVWAPHVIEEAKDHGLVLGESGRLYDTKNGETLSDNDQPIGLLTEDEMAEFPELSVDALVPRFIARLEDCRALALDKPAIVLANNPQALINDKPGFEIEFLSERTPVQSRLSSRHQVLMGQAGHWRVQWVSDSGSIEHITMAAGDTLAIPPNVDYQVAAAMTGQAGLYCVKDTDDAPGRTEL